MDSQNNLAEELTNSVIVLDTDNTENENSENSVSYDPIALTLAINEDPQSIFQFVRKASKGQLVLDPDFQRNQVWKQAQKSRFIESILMNFPIPPLYVNEQADGKWAIIDGLQRTTTLIAFLNNEFALEGLTALKNLNGKTFSEGANCLDAHLQSRIEDKKLIIYILKSSTPLAVIYELFDRINTGGTPLNRQEVRHCIYKGKSTVLLKALSEQNYFKQAIDGGVSPTRMKDREIILRFLSFLIFDYEKDYQGDLSLFVENAMKHINTKMSDTEIKALEANFERVMRHSFDFFGKNNFRYPRRDENTKAIISRGNINTSIFESVCVFFANKDNDFLLRNKARIIANFDALLLDSKYEDAVRFSTGSKSKVINRFKFAEQILGDIS